MNFGEAWEGLCYGLLAAQFGTKDLIRLEPPDRGVDILHRLPQEAFQCKAAEAGTTASMSATASLQSLATACDHRGAMGWRRYCYATNAHYTGSAYESIVENAAELGLDVDQEISFLGPEHWSELCETHFDRVKDRFDYRVSVAEKEVIDALRKAGYFQKYVDQFAEKIRNAHYKIVVSNNRTPIELEIPFAPDLSVENCLDAAKTLLGVSLDWTNFDELNTSAGPSLSLTIDGFAKGLSQKISDIALKPGQPLQLWIKIVWREGKKGDGQRAGKTSLLHRWAGFGLYDTANGKHRAVDRGKETVAREESILQGMMWKSVAALRKPGDASDPGLFTNRLRVV